MFKVGDEVEHYERGLGTVRKVDNRLILIEFYNKLEHLGYHRGRTSGLVLPSSCWWSPPHTLSPSNLSMENE